MRLKINIHILISFALSIFSFMTFWVYSNLFGEELIFYLGIPFSLLIFCLFYFLAKPSIERVVIVTSYSKMAFLSLALTIVSVFLLTFIPPYEGSIINWVDVPLQNWLRGLASLLLTSFFPGYFLLKIADKNKTITGGALIVLSNLLSMFVMFLLGFSTLLLGNTISSSSVVAIVIANLLLATLYYLIFNIQKDRSKFTFFFKGHDSIILLTLCVVMIGAFAVMLFGMPLTQCDMWFIHSQALELSKGFPAVMYYPYLFSIYLSLVFAVSGLHSAITMQLLYVFSFMPVLGFYSMVKQWFTEKRNEKIAVVATFFSILLGFGSLYLLYSKVVNPEQTFPFLAEIAVNKTYDSYWRFPFAPYMVVLRWTVGLTVLFSLLYLLKNESCKIRSLLFTLLISIGYLGHAPEVVFFIPLLVVWTIFFQPNSNWRISFSILLGFLIVGIIDFLAPTQIYVLSLNASTGNNSISLPYAISVLVVTLLLGVEIAKHKGFSVLAMRQRIFSIVEKTWRYAKWLLLYSYLFCITVWICVVKDYNLWLYGGFNFVSFFIFPIRWGAIGLIAILSIFFYFSDIIRDKVLSFFMLVFAIGIALEQVGNYFPIYYTDIERYAAIICIGGSIIAAYGIERMLCCFARRFSGKKLVSSFLLFLLILTGALSTTVYYTHMTYLNGRDEVISNNELQALEYIKNNLSSEESVLTFTYASAFKLGTFAGISFQSLYPYGTSNLDRNIVNYGFLETENPYILTYMLGASNTRYIYVAKEDATLLSSKHFLINSFLKYLPEVFKSPDVTLYEVPRLIPPSHNLDSSLGVIHLFPSKNLLSFDGADDYVEFEDNYSLRPTSISIELRFKKNGNFGYKFLVDKSKSSWVSYAFMGTYDNKLRFIVGIDSGITERHATTTTIFKDDEWYHVIGVYDGNRIAIYVNGELEDETTYEESKGIYYDGNNPLRIGTHVFEANSYFKGSIDYIRIYNRTISKDEINYSYKNNIPKNVTDLILYLDFEGNLKDDSGNENDGINHGATFVSSSIYSENDSFMALLMATLGSRYSILYADDVLTEHLDMYLSNYTCIILTSDPKVSFSNILNWVSAGHTLVVFNTNRDGFFARLLDLNFSSGNLINVREFNSGKIVYIDIYSRLVSCEEHKLLSQTDFISMVKNAFYIPSYNTSASTIGRPGATFNMTYGEFEVIGNLSIFTDLLVLENATLLNPNFTHSKTFTTSVYGRSTLNIQNATLFVFPSESYLLVKPENNLIQGQILVDSKVTLQISDSVGNSTIMNETQKVLNFQAEELLAKLPAVNASGEIIFKSLYTHIVPYIPLAGIALQKAEIQGSVKFDTMYVSNPLTIFSMFQAEGKILNLAETTSLQTIPWAEVLSSPYNLAFNTIFLLGIAIYIVKKRKAKTTVNKEIE